MFNLLVILFIIKMYACKINFIFSSILLWSTKLQGACCERKRKSFRTTRMSNFEVLDLEKNSENLDIFSHNNILPAIPFFLVSVIVAVVTMFISTPKKLFKTQQAIEKRASYWKQNKLIKPELVIENKASYWKQSQLLKKEQVIKNQNKLLKTEQAIEKEQTIENRTS